MKKHKFQQIRVTVNKPGDSIRFNAQTDKQYARIRGIYVSIPEERLVPGCLLGLKVNNQDIFEDVHEVKLLTSGNQVAPNKKFFFFEEHLDAAGSTVEGRFKDGQTQLAVASLAANVETGFSSYCYPYEVKIYLWLTNEK
jgi:hypothetical protein